MLYQWLSNPIIKIGTIEIVIEALVNVIEMLGNVIARNVKLLPLSQSVSGLGRFFECWKCNILVVTQALVFYLHSPLGAQHPWTSCVYIRQSTLTCIITYTSLLRIYVPYSIVRNVGSGKTLVNQSSICQTFSCHCCESIY